MVEIVKNRYMLRTRRYQVIFFRKYCSVRKFWQT